MSCLCNSCKEIKFSAVSCIAPECEYTIDTSCVLNTKEAISCNNSIFPDISSYKTNIYTTLINIESEICYILSKEFITANLNTIKNNSSFLNQFCTITCSCDC